MFVSVSDEYKVSGIIIVIVTARHVSELDPPVPGAGAGEPPGDQGQAEHLGLQPPVLL